MFQDGYQMTCNVGVGKWNFLQKNPLGYFISSMLAGMFVSFGSFIAFTLGQAANAGGAVAFVKLIQAFAFSSALSLVITAGAELFTGNNFVVAAASMKKMVSWVDTIKLWSICWIGNLLGSVLSVVAFQLTGAPTASDGALADYFIQVSTGKVGYSPVSLVVRAILCNILICLAIWCFVKMKSESGKLIMVFWCILIFMGCGFEHCIANMSIIGVAVFNHGVTLGQYFYNILWATVGNVIGGVVFVALPYYIISKEC